MTKRCEILFLAAVVVLTAVAAYVAVTQSGMWSAP